MEKKSTAADVRSWNLWPVGVIKRGEAAERAWKTRRAKKNKRSKAAIKAWKTRRKNIKH